MRVLPLQGGVVTAEALGTLLPSPSAPIKAALPCSPDPGCLLYWAHNSQEANDLYGTIDSNTIGNVIDSIYLALFGRMPDPVGKQFYIDGFNNGTFTAGTIALNILYGARNEDAVTIQNKLAPRRFVWIWSLMGSNPHETEESDEQPGYHQSRSWA